MIGWVFTGVAPKTPRRELEPVRFVGIQKRSPEGGTVGASFIFLHVRAARQRISTFPAGPNSPGGTRPWTCHLDPPWEFLQREKGTSRDKTRFHRPPNTPLSLSFSVPNLLSIRAKHTAGLMATGVFFS